MFALRGCNATLESYHPLVLENTFHLILKAREKFMINCIEQEGRPESGPSTIRWVKIFTWRANGDGIGLGKHTLLEGDFYIHWYTYSLQVDKLV